MILLLGFLLRVFFLTQELAPPVARDQMTYFTLAHAMQRDLLHYSEIFRPPLYPAFLAFVFHFAGDTRFAVGIAQALLDTCNIALVLALARVLFNQARISLLTAFLYAIYPEAIEMTRLLFSEILYLFLSGLGIWILLSRRGAKTYRQIFFVGICFGLAALTREIMAYFAILIVPLWLGLALPRRRHAWVQILCLLGGLAVILAPWVLRNWQIEERFVLVSTSGEYNLIKDNLSLLKRVNDNSKLAQAESGGIQLPRRDREINKLLVQQPPDRRAAYAAQVALRIVALDPLAWLITKASSVGSFWSANTRLTPFTRESKLPQIVNTTLRPLAGAYIIALSFFAALGLFFARENSSKLLILLYIAYSAGVFLITHFQIRYRIPLVPFLMPYAAFAALSWKDWRKPSRRLGAALAVAFLFLWLAIGQSP
ncbi:MAG: glycosyltransferase family 39 protein [Chloroflexi bacterium]|nr:glycosyltransferase family 39 protein [Chloroflexota bacterium]MBI4761756.1 glycosyltransferase family 39 protein [Chloroflexota bacterium]